MDNGVDLGSKGGGTGPSKRVELWGNKETMNLHNILYINVLASPYFKGLYEKHTFHEVVDEIYYNVSTLEPFFKGTNASSAFCLLFKLFKLKLTERQVQSLLDHTDSPHIRALGFLYLRYATNPASLWEWFEPYLDDEEEVPVKGGPLPKTMTIGAFCKVLLRDQKWFDTILPRIPVPIARDIEQKLRDRSGIPVAAASSLPSTRAYDRSSTRLSIIGRVNAFFHVALADTFGCIKPPRALPALLLLFCQ
ncbi:PRP38 family-domain-containing protein [Entophlyctis helioformis]|nr:PRP38 family-domain-containing protein [Entophlyctis helioformis]